MSCANNTKRPIIACGYCNFEKRLPHEIRPFENKVVGYELILKSYIHYLQLGTFLRVGQTRWLRTALRARYRRALVDIFSSA